MSSLMNTLDKLDYFSKKNADVKARGMALVKEQQVIDQEFEAWAEKELGLKGQLPLVDLLKTVLEKTLDVGRIIKP